MWSPIVLCLLVGFAVGSRNPQPAWKENSEYIYSIRGRTLASLHEVANQYSGIMYKAEMKIQPKSDGSLQGLISNPEFTSIHTHLPFGWKTEIPESEIDYKPLEWSNSPFQIEMKEGVIYDVIVNKDVPNWEANMIKSIVSQFQLNTNGENHMQSKLTALPEDDDQNSAVFKVMEETVTGKIETTYDIHPLPEYILQSEPWLVRYPDLKGNGEVIEVVKHKNYTNNEELPLYHYGFGEMNEWKPATNQMGSFFIRDSMSRAILTGTLKRYTIQNSFTVNEIIMSPSLNDKQKGSVVSVVNATLQQIQSKTQRLREVPNPIPLGNLVYTYDNSKSDSVRQKKPSQNDESSEESRYQRSATMNRIRRAIRDHHDNNDDRHDSHGSSSEEQKDKEYYQQGQPKLEEAPRSPLLPYTTGYKGMSIKYDPNVDIKKTVHETATQIGNELQDPEEILKQNTLNKFTILTTLIRSMDLKELKEVAADLYSSNENGPRRDTWTTFRDAVAESGTGPALVIIQEWTESGKIKEEEAATIVATMTSSVRQPTRDYLKSFFDFIRDPKVQSQDQLHDSALLSFSNLVRQVCVNKRQANRQFPVNSFGTFCTSEAKRDVEESMIPYFTEKLDESILKGDTHKIHTYIRALGNIGHQHILVAFEPYLEGKKQASQFQRLLMVMAMDRLVETKPKVARSVLYKIYQNAGESEELRVAAVHQIMRTNPPTDMLQRMASYTNIDSQEHVNAAVKSSIERASELNSEEYQWLRLSATAARPLLTKKSFGKQHGMNYLRSHVMDELKLKYTIEAHYMGSEEEFYPKGFKYSVTDDLGGVKRQLATLQAIVSSIDELEHVAKYQTSEHQEQMQNQQQNAEQQKQYPWSSLNIARLLNMKSDEREQLEGSLYSEFNGALQWFWTFDNKSMEQLPEEIRKREEELKNGKDYHYTKFSNSREIALSFPTESGLPFLFTSDSPTMVKVEGRVTGESSPQISSGGKLHRPDTMTLKAEISLTVNAKTESRLSFMTPFDEHRYISGFDKNIQVHIPVYGNFKVDLKNGQIEAEIENKEKHQGARLFHYSTWPYTSKIDINNFKPISSESNTHYVQQKNLRSYNRIFGQKDLGVAWKFEIEHERQSMSMASLSHLMKDHDIVTGLAKLWDDASIQYGQMSIQLLPEESSVRKYTIRLGYDYKYMPQGSKTQAPSRRQLSSLDPLARKESLIDTLGAGINNAKVFVWDSSIEFQGGSNTKLLFTGGVGKSDVDPKSRVVAYYKKSSNSQDDYEVTVQAKSEIPNTNGLDLAESFATEPKADTTVEVEFGQSSETPSKAQFKFQCRRSEERKQYLEEQDMYRECQREMREGNYQLPACANMTMDANLLDSVDIEVTHKNIKEEMRDVIDLLYKAIQLNYYPSLEVEEDKGTGDDSNVKVLARFDPDLRSVNVSVQAKDNLLTIKNIQVNEWAQKVFVVHPVFHLQSRLKGSLLSLDTYRPICVVDQTHASTFNNMTYPVPLDNHWTLMMQYVPKDARHSEQQVSVEEQLRRQPENYAVLTRQNPSSSQQKDIKITVSSPETDFKVIDITMTPSGSKGKSQKAKVTVNNNNVQFSDEKAYDVKDGYIQIYSLPNGEVKVEVRKAFYIIYDGQRAKLTVVNGKFRDSIRGLCGTFTDEKYDDLLTPENCITGNYEKFIKSFEVEGSEGAQQRREFARRTPECVYRESPLYANVISEQDKGKKSLDDSNRNPPATKFQTRYVELNGEICFTTRPVPVCTRMEQQRGSITKNVPAHCMQKSNVSKLWKAQIDRGASPDFSHKKQSRSVEMELPKSCSR